MLRRWRHAQPGPVSQGPHQQGRILFQVDTQVLNIAGVHVAAASDPGCVREQNEDFVGVFTPPRDASSPPEILAVLADGMGGHAAGEVASEVAISTIAALFYQPDSSSRTDTLPGETAESARRLYEAFLAADQAIRRASHLSPEQGGMGCTCVAAAISGDELFLAHVGDARAYLIQPVAEAQAGSSQSMGSIRQLTADHSFAAEMVRAGLLAEAEARASPRRHVVTRALGGRLGEPACIPEIQRLHLQAGNIVVLCCDGLWNMVSDDQIAATILQTPLDHACASLIELAKEAGGDDNISLILLQVYP
jgi:serine/threonine protein phosphatase PrpC